MRMIALIGLTLLGVSGAQADSHAVPRGMVCQTEIAVESLYEFHKVNPEASLVDGVAMVNSVDKSANCTITALIYDLGSIVATIHVDDSLMDIRKVSVIALCSKDGCIPAWEQGFSAFTMLPTS